MGSAGRGGPPGTGAQRRYELIRTIGQGAFGTVYLARLVGPGGFEKQVAVKILSPQFAGNPELASRLRDEARILGLVRHQAIVQVDGLLQVQGRWGVVMEYVEGLDLFGILRRVPMPPRAALEMLEHLASALAFAWTVRSPEGEPLRLIHRDIKPSNIKVTTTGETKILDFGIARAEFDARESLTQNEAFGTPQYMAPERFEFHDGPEGDIYSLGVVLFECLTRRMLYERRAFGREDRHTDRVVQAQEIAWEATGQVSADLIHLLGGMLAFHPEARPTAQEVSQRCESLIDELRGARLKTWARASLPPILEELSPQPDDSLTGAILIEEGGELAERARESTGTPTPVMVYKAPVSPLASDPATLTPTRDQGVPSLPSPIARAEAAPGRGHGEPLPNPAPVPPTPPARPDPSSYQGVFALALLLAMALFIGFLAFLVGMAIFRAALDSREESSPVAASSLTPAPPLSASEPAPSDPLEDQSAPGLMISGTPPPEEITEAPLDEPPAPTPPRVESQRNPSPAPTRGSSSAKTRSATAVSPETATTSATNADPWGAEQGVAPSQPSRQCPLALVGPADLVATTRVRGEDKVLPITAPPDTYIVEVHSTTRKWSRQVTVVVPDTCKATIIECRKNSCKVN